MNKRGPDKDRCSMVGISNNVDLPATLAMRKLKKTPLGGLTPSHAKQINLAITTGSIRAGDRLKAAKLQE